jgi:hypothetical protein
VIDLVLFYSDTTGCLISGSDCVYLVQNWENCDLFKYNKEISSSIKGDQISSFYLPSLTGLLQVKFDVLKEVNMQTTICLHKTPCSLLKRSNKVSKKPITANFCSMQSAAGSFKSLITYP